MKFKKKLFVISVIIVSLSAAGCIVVPPFSKLSSPAYHSAPPSPDYSIPPPPPDVPETEPQRQNLDPFARWQKGHWKWNGYQYSWRHGYWAHCEPFFIFLQCE